MKQRSEGVLSVRGRGGWEGGSMRFGVVWADVAGRHPVRIGLVVVARQYYCVAVAFVS